MLNKETVFVVGAGASHEFGLPTGPTLATKISALLDVKFDDWGRELISGDEQIWRTACHVSQGRDRAIHQACWLIRDGVALSSSIDDFLDTHVDNQAAQLCGRLGIVKAVLQAERASSLFIHPRGRDGEIAFAGLSATWLSHLFRILQKNVRIAECKRLFDRATFVVFNYDRCLEHFLFRAVRRIYSLSDQAAAEIVASAKIIHPYGTVGALPWQGSGNAVEFGADDANLGELSSGIRTYTDRLDDPQFLEGIKATIEGARTLVFLGFAYHSQNLDLLFPAQAVKPDRVLGTAFGISAFNRDAVEFAVRSKLEGKRGQSLDILNGLKCGDLLDQYSSALLKAG